MNHEPESRESLISELSERLFNGLVKENPTFVLLLGMCPTLAVTTCAINGLGMGVTTMVVLALSNLFISLLRKIIPDKVRIPAFIVIIASFVTMVELLLEAYIPSLYDALGLYIPLIVVNCIILGRAEAYAYSHKPIHSLFDGLGMGMGFTIALTIIGSFRELLGAGTLFSVNVMPKGYTPVSIFIMAPGAFFVLAMLTAIQNKVKEIGEKKGKDMSKIQSGCGGNCAECNLECSTPDKKTLTEENSEAAESNSSTYEKSKISKGKKRKKPADKEEKLSTEEIAELSTEEEVKDTEESENTEASENTPSKTEKNKPDKRKKNSKGKIKKEEPEEAANTESSDEKKISEDVIESKEEVSDKEDSASGSETKAEAGAKIETDADAKTDEKVDTKADAEDSQIDSDIELLDISDYKSVLKAAPVTGNKPRHKKSSMAKAQAMLNKAEMNTKEDGND